MWYANFPRYYHLFWNNDLESLRPALENVSARQREIVWNSYQLYVCHFSHSRTLSESEFIRTFESSLEHQQRAFLSHDISEYAKAITQTAEHLCKQQVSLDELLASLLFLKQSVRCILEQQLSSSARSRLAFDRMSDLNILLALSSYFRSEPAIAENALGVPGSEAARLPSLTEKHFHGLVGESAPMRRLYERIQLAGATIGNLLIVGESGSGKELVARAIHKSGPRREMPFVALNCAALPKDLIESELFGYKRGAFSGANTDHLGLFRSAEDGTLFLDEITEMDLATQSKLLRALQERAIRPVGSAVEQRINARVIASTNRDPASAVADGHLREDLYYRLQAAVLEVPPLRERREDIPLLVEHFMKEFKERHGRSVAGIEQRALDAVINYGWPGNVRELSNAIEGAFTFGKSHLITLQDLPPAVAAVVPRADSQAEQGRKGVPSLVEAECRVIRDALQKTGGNKVAAARLLGISRKRLYDRIVKYGLSAA